MKVFRNFVFSFIAAAAVHAADDTPANLQLRIASTDTLKYAWTITSVSDSKGKERGRDFTLTADSSYAMSLIIKGQPGKKEGLQPVGVRVRDQIYTDKRSIDNSKTDVYISKTKVKIVQDGKAVIDSDNDIGLDKIGQYQEQFKVAEASETRMMVDLCGRQSDVTGDPAIVESVRNSGAQGIFPILPGKEVKPGDRWEDQFNMTKIGEFKLAKPIVVKSKMVFAGWEQKDGRKLARIDLTSMWDPGDLRGENESGMLVEITKVDGHGAGTCLFDPEKGQFLDGSITFSIKYRIDGEKDGERSGLDVTGKSNFNFVLQP